MSSRLVGLIPLPLEILLYIEELQYRHDYDLVVEELEDRFAAEEFLWHFYPQIFIAIYFDLDPF